ncbi:Scr1 family TA system antitoxin-like transcriptional regulator, partial [Nocardia sp. NPDC060255]|uniref:Scr1 family TA system antitoxin-like transcriptional regulator n=1 Tax=Nocardia sp. NPDC060255 TaxID=3347085 RepID=UPI00365C2E85
MPQAIKARMARQRLMTAASPLHLEVVVEDDTLGRLVGGPEVMLAQLRHLLDLMKQPNVKLQVMPKAAAVHVGLDGDFTLLSFGEAQEAFDEPCRGAGRQERVARRHGTYGVEEFGGSGVLH